MAALLAAASWLLRASRQPIWAYRHPGDAAIATFALPMGLFGVFPCTDRVVGAGGVVFVNRPTDQCVKMQPRRRFRGIYLHEFEAELFFEDVTDPAEAWRRRDSNLRRRGPSGEWLGASISWMSLEPTMRRVLEAASADQPVLLEFEGRRTAYRGRYGHLGMSESEVIVDRVISAQPVYLPRPAP